MNEESLVVISRPCKVPASGGKVKLSCSVRVPNLRVPDELYFLCDERYAEYLVYERADAFDISSYRAHPWRMAHYLMKDALFHVDYLMQMRESRKCGEWRLPLPFWVYVSLFHLGEFLEWCADCRRQAKRFLGLRKK